ncbi:ATP-binding protein [Nucisporomicrobium flavum]|uniref:ATP-binding protein n=1 Tax=Nucisporomicrobium flavum TaxID=2785915 RepID=UPI003C2C2602
MDIDSPFLDLFGSPASQHQPAAAPPDDPDADFDFGFDFEGEDARRAAGTPAPPPAATGAPGAPSTGPGVPSARPVSPAAAPPPQPSARPVSPPAPGPEANGHPAGMPPSDTRPTVPLATGTRPVTPVSPAPLSAEAPFERPISGQPDLGGPASARPASGPPAPAQPTSGPPALPQPTSGPPAPAQPTSGPPAPAQPTSGAPAFVRPTSAPPVVAPPSGFDAPGGPVLPLGPAVQPVSSGPAVPPAPAAGPAVPPAPVAPAGQAVPLGPAMPLGPAAPAGQAVPLGPAMPLGPAAASGFPDAPVSPFMRAPVGPQADFYEGREDDDDLDFADWPEQARPGVAAPVQPVMPDLITPAPVPAQPLWQQAAGPAPGVHPVAPLTPYVNDAEPDHHADLAPMPEKAPAQRAEKAVKKRRKKRDEPDNLPAVREKKDAKPAVLRPHKLKFSDRDPAIELEISEIAGHLTFTQSTVTAWYYLPEVRWAFRPDAEREALLSAISEQYAGLAGFRLHLRRTNRPFPADEWARTVDSFTAKPLPDVTGGTSWSDHLVAAQRHLLSVNHAEGQTYLGVTFARRSLGDTFSERILRLFGKGTSDGERRKLGRTVEQFDEVLNAFGMRGRRVTPQELEWLLFRSVALCMAPPGPLSPVSNGHWERGDLLALTEQVERYRTPYGSTVKLVNRMTGEERHVAVLSVGRMEPLEIPEKHEPWMHFHERLPWPMELSSRIDILGPNSSFKNLEHRLRMIRSQQLDYAEHGIDAPPELERLAKRALVIGDEMTTGLPVESARAHGWHRIAVGGRTREECLERARRLIQLYSRELRISLQHPKNQDQLAREFIPGEPIANTGYVRRMPVKLLAAALPQAASTVGDRRGDLIGRTAGTCRRPVFLDLHFPMEVRERSGLGVFVAEPGGGKSTLMGALGYLNARRGVQVTLLDPSGPLARLCQMPELRPYSRVLNLTGSEQGTLAPYALIPTPVRTEFATGPGGDREYEIAVSNARAERRMLVQDICSMLVPPQVAKEASTATLLRHAVRQVPAEETSTLDDVVATLQGLDNDEGKELANLLLDTAEMPLALLFFGRPPQHLLGADSALTVITMAGLRLPDLKIEREYWSAEESLALPMLHTAHRLAVRRCYGGSMSSRKMVGLDEAHFMEGWRSGRSFLVRLARDSRKWNLAALVASQNPRDILGLDVQNLVSTVFVGRIAEDQEIASEALRLLRVPVHDGYEATLASLSQADTSSSARLGFREFVMRDVDGRVQKVRVDVSYVDGLLEHLDTTPAAAKAAPTAIPSLSDLEV